VMQRVLTSRANASFLAVPVSCRRPSKCTQQQCCHIRPSFRVQQESLSTSLDLQTSAAGVHAQASRIQAPIWHTTVGQDIPEGSLTHLSCL
jgi:hypothetical protein